MWNERLKEQLALTGMSQSELARAINRHRQQVYNWVQGLSEPQPDAVFAMEDALDCRDYLSAPLGYVRYEPTDPLDCLRRDDRLSAEDRRTLIRMYQALAGD